MLQKILIVVFYVGVGLFFLHVAFPYLEVIVGVDALILGILAAVQ